MHQRLSSTPDQAQEIVFPIVMNGTIESIGEVDFYRFDVLQPCELTIEVRPLALPLTLSKLA